MTPTNRRLNLFIYRTLTLRLALATLLLAAVLAAGLFVAQRNKVADLVVETALNRISMLRGQTLQLLEQQETEPTVAFQAALHAIQSANLQQQLGKFIYARFYTSEGQIFAESITPETDRKSLSALLETPQRYPHTTPWHRAIWIDNSPHIQVVAAIKGRGTETVAYAEGIFALSDSAISQQRTALLRSIGWVVLIVLVTAAILYPVIIKLTQRLAGYSEELLTSHLETVQILGSAIAKRDSDTSAHNFRVTIMAIKVAEVLGLSQATIKQLIIGAFLHDVGKIGIRDEILLKPASLDEGEYAVMKTHVNHGIDIISRSEWLNGELPEHVDVGVELLSNSSWLGAANKVVGYHHEKYDGSGYPNGLAGEAIPLEARIFSVVDVFDALTCKRPYKQPFSFEKSMTILDEGRGNHFDPLILDAFNQLADQFYEQIAGREDKQLQTELDAAAGHYFYAGLDTLDY